MAGPTSDVLQRKRTPQGKLLYGRGHYLCTAAAATLHAYRLQGSQVRHITFETSTADRGVSVGSTNSALHQARWARKCTCV
jgi:hypothetical protein